MSYHSIGGLIKGLFWAASLPSAVVIQRWGNRRRAALCSSRCNPSPSFSPSLRPPTQEWLVPVTGSRSDSARPFVGWAAAPCPTFGLSAAEPAANARHRSLGAHRGNEAPQSRKKRTYPWTDGRSRARNWRCWIVGWKRNVDKWLMLEMSNWVRFSWKKKKKVPLDSQYGSFKLAEWISGAKINQKCHLAKSHS